MNNYAKSLEITFKMIVTNDQRKNAIPGLLKLFKYELVEGDFQNANESIKFNDLGSCPAFEKIIIEYFCTQPGYTLWTVLKHGHFKTSEDSLTELNSNVASELKSACVILVEHFIMGFLLHVEAADIDKKKLKSSRLKKEAINRVFDSAKDWILSKSGYNSLHGIRKIIQEEDFLGAAFEIFSEVYFTTGNVGSSQARP